MNNGRLDRVLLFAILVAVGGLHWQVFSMNQRLSGEIADLGERLCSEIASLNDRLAGVETHLEYIATGAAGPSPEQLPA